MLANIIDRRSNPYKVQCDAVLEPSWRDNSCNGADQFEQTEVGVNETYVEMPRTTVFEAVAAAGMRGWPVTVYLYDLGSGAA